MTENKVWYQDGLKFTCTQCGNCCTGAPGVVWVNQAEVGQIAEHLGTSVGETRLEYTRLIGNNRTSLKEYPNGDCVFFDSQSRKCKIYPVRPRQCRTWPFWNSNLESSETWQEVQQTCPGAGNGNFVSLDEIKRRTAVINL